MEHREAFSMYKETPFCIVGFEQVWKIVSEIHSLFEYK